MGSSEAKSPRFRRVLPKVLLCAAFLLAPAPLQAASLSVEGEGPRGSITVTIEDAPLAFVLDDLRMKYGFEIDGLEHATSPDLLSMTISGTLPGILERLLRNRNHLIVRSSDSPCGIAKVMILDSGYGAGPPRAPASDPYGHAVADE
jgi:hypothetical protein